MSTPPETVIVPTQTDWKGLISFALLFSILAICLLLIYEKYTIIEITTFLSPFLILLGTVIHAWFPTQSD